MAGHKGLLKQTSDLFTVANFGEQMHVWNLGDERNDVLSQLNSQPILSRAGQSSQMLSSNQWASHATRLFGINIGCRR